MIKRFLSLFKDKSKVLIEYSYPLNSEIIGQVDYIRKQFESYLMTSKLSNFCTYKYIILKDTFTIFKRVILIINSQKNKGYNQYISICEYADCVGIVHWLEVSEGLTFQSIDVKSWFNIVAWNLEKAISDARVKNINPNFNFTL